MVCSVTVFLLWSHDSHDESNHRPPDRKKHHLKFCLHTTLRTERGLQKPAPIVKDRNRGVQ
jgi:hypothetical protein